MDQPAKIKPVPSSAATTSSCSGAPSCKPPNPYARDSSRRAIACVTCAKAKTRCDKALPSCSRCVTKGIKCDPRSTRRTSDNNHRPLSTKKPFLSSKRFATPGILSSSSAFPSPRSIPSSRQQGVMRAPSHIDFRTAVKMSQQAAIISGVPKLAPLPTYHNQIVDECYSYDLSPEPDLCRFTPESEQAFSRGTTPQTPAEPMGYHEPFSLVDDLDYLDCQTWSGNELVPVGLGFSDMEMPAEEWMTPTPEPEEMAQANMFALNPSFATPLQVHSNMEATSNGMTADWSSFQTPAQNHSASDAKPATALSSLGDCSFDSGIVMQSEWTQSQPHGTYVHMGHMVTSAPYVPKMQGMPDNAPVWEDVFMPSSVPN
ncbi:uncharacterized protein EKO05_0000936 [Ascochyta rabiei]|uniref:uncharacterized protein n=1 Tax=Didymella rabiei TaxID=5454 RepID=UPI0021FB54FC|nr:uncharacterized protein EKO05_0000936 [Ascochyta rabiei]UPX10269.1 hypothetical protein EKO05_0000936 [Ascochyta rabiei]